MGDISYIIVESVVLGEREWLDDERMALKLSEFTIAQLANDHHSHLHLAES